MISKLMIGLTYKCNSKCKHCMFLQSRKDDITHADKELSLDEIKRLVIDAKKLKAQKINLFGGEPTLRKDIFKIIETVSCIIPNVVMDTNGILINEEFAKKLKKSGLKKVYISLMSADKSTHNDFTGVNSFNQVIRAIKVCLKHGITTDISTVATRKKIENQNLKKLIEFGKKLGVNAIRVELPTCSGCWKTNYDGLLSESEKKEIFKLVDGNFIYLEADEGIKDVICGSIYGGFYYTSPYGDVQPCCFVPVTLGNIRSEPLKKILFRFYRHPLFANKSLYKKNYCMMRDPKFLSIINSYLSKPLIRLDEFNLWNKLGLYSKIILFKFRNRIENLNAKYSNNKKSKES